MKANVVATYFLPESEPHKFLLLTPLCIVLAYKRVHCVTSQSSSIPSSSCIIQDICRVIHSMKVIVGVKGNVVEGLWIVAVIVVHMSTVYLLMSTWKSEPQGL